MVKFPWLERLVLASILLAFCVILLGAYTRLVDAGLGCPDWPGCYGQLTAPSTSAEIAAAHQVYPDTPVHIGKARTEMTHRYFAESLGSLIMLFAVIAYWKRRFLTMPLWLPPLLVVLVLVQGLLGMWTVTLRLFPFIVLSHLLGGFLTLSLLWLSWLHLRQQRISSFSFPPFLSKLAFITLGVLFLQILLGGWTSANYAALVCPNFPSCHGQGWGPFNIQAFNFAQDYMDFSSKATVHMIHRIGALLTLSLGIILSFCLWQQSRLRRYSLWIGFLLLLQVGLGISNVLLFLPLPIAVAHNGIAALLLLTMVALNFKLQQARSLRV